MQEFLEEDRKQLLQLGYTDRQIYEFEHMNEREMKAFLRKELIQSGCTDQQLEQLEEFDQLFKSRWCYPPWDSRSGWIGGSAMGVLIGIIILLIRLITMQN